MFFKFRTYEKQDAQLVGSSTSYYHSICHPCRVWGLLFSCVQVLFTTCEFLFSCVWALFGPILWAMVKINKQIINTFSDGEEWHLEGAAVGSTYSNQLVHLVCCRWSTPLRCVVSVWLLWLEYNDFPRWKREVLMNARYIIIVWNSFAPEPKQHFPFKTATKLRPWCHLL